MKKIIKLTPKEFTEKKRFFKNKIYLIEDEQPIYSINEFRNFQRFIENLIITTRHLGIKIRASLLIEKEGNFK